MDILLMGPPGAGKGTQGALLSESMGLPTFATGNLLGFHRRDGAGYVFLADQVLALDPLNPLVAARMVSFFNPWRRFDAQRQAAMRMQLERIAARPGLSKDVYEIVGRALA